MNICLYGASSKRIDKEYIIKGEELGRIIASRSHSLIFGGGASGMMGACARGVTENGGKVIGISPNFFNVDGILYDKCTELILTDTMRERKKKLEELSDGFIISPGGIGTFDEFFEILTLKQLDQHKKPIAVFNINGYYDSLIELIKTGIKQNFIKEKNLNLFTVTDDAEKIVDYIENYSHTDTDIKKYR